MTQELMNHLESEAYYTKVISERNVAILQLFKRISELEKMLEDTQKSKKTEDGE